MQRHQGIRIEPITAEGEDGAPDYHPLASWPAATGPLDVVSPRMARRLRREARGR